MSRPGKCKRREIVLTMSGADGAAADGPAVSEATGSRDAANITDTTAGVDAMFIDTEVDYSKAGHPSAFDSIPSASNDKNSILEAMSTALNAGEKSTMELVEQFQSLLEYKVNEMAGVVMDPQSSIIMKTFAAGSGLSLVGDKMKELENSVANHSGFVNDLGICQLEQKKEVDDLKIERADVAALVKLLLDRLWKIETKIEELTGGRDCTGTTDDGPKAFELALDAPQLSVNNGNAAFERRVQKLENQSIMAQLGHCGGEQSGEGSVAAIMMQYRDLERQKDGESLRKEMGTCQGHHDNLNGGKMKLAVQQDQFEKRLEKMEKAVSEAQVALKEGRELRMMLAMYFDGQINKQDISRMLNNEEV